MREQHDRGAVAISSAMLGLPKAGYAWVKGKTAEGDVCGRYSPGCAVNNCVIVIHTVMERYQSPTAIVTKGFRQNFDVLPYPFETAGDDVTTYVWDDRCVPVFFCKRKAFSRAV